MNLTNAGAPEELQVVAASAGLFPLLGVDAPSARTFDADDDRPGGLGVVLLSDDSGVDGSADVTLVGRTPTARRPFYVVRGVLPRGFTLPPARRSARFSGRVGAVGAAR